MSTFDALDDVQGAMREARHLTVLLHLSALGVATHDKASGEALLAGVGALREKLSEIDVCIEVALKEVA